MWSKWNFAIIIRKCHTRNSLNSKNKTTKMRNMKYAFQMNHSTNTTKCDDENAKWRYFKWFKQCDANDSTQSRKNDQSSQIIVDDAFSRIRQKIICKRRIEHLRWINWWIFISCRNWHAIHIQKQRNAKLSKCRFVRNSFQIIFTRWIWWIITNLRVIYELRVSYSNRMWNALFANRKHNNEMMWSKWTKWKFVVCVVVIRRRDMQHAQCVWTRYNVT
jgi:hypothetical protein